jgi:hypothetical protein
LAPDHFNALDFWGVARQLQGDGLSVDTRMKSGVRIWTEVSTPGLQLMAQTPSQDRRDSLPPGRTRIFAANWCRTRFLFFLPVNTECTAPAYVFRIVCKR